MTRGAHPIALSARRRGSLRALRLLYELARRPATFEEYSGHLLLAFSLIGTTSRSAALSRRALEMGRERARCWRSGWPRTRGRLDADTVMREVIACYAAARMGMRVARVRRDLQRAAGAFSPRELLYFDPAEERPPHDVPEDCARGHVNDRGRVSCRACGARLRPRSRYDVWYYALTNSYFCERAGIRVGVRFADVMRQLPTLRPYPKPGSRHYYDSLYAVTHVVYTLNDYGSAPLSPREHPAEFRFLEASVPWALEQGEADTIGEVLDSLAAFGVDDRHPLMARGRTFLLEHQRADGGWGDEGDDYGRFHTVWAAIDGLRDFSWQEPAAEARPRRHTNA